MSLIRADARAIPLVDGCVQCVVTSPPYWGLRDYGAAGQIGLESTPEAFVASLVAVFAEVRRVLKNDGTVWLNLGDSYANDGKWGGETGGKQSYLPDNDRQQVGREKRVTGLKPKDLVGIPWMVAFALRSDGWYLRASAPWLKRNVMPESVKDRPNSAVEQIFLLSKRPVYYYDPEAVKKVGAIPAGTRAAKGSDVRSELKDVNGRPPEYWEYTGERNRRNSDWFFESWQGLIGDEDGEPLAFVVNTRPYPGAHYATFPPALVEPCVKASSKPGDLVFDPFIGSGTVGEVAERLSRRWVGTDISYQHLAKKRTRQRGLRLEAS